MISILFSFKLFKNINFIKFNLYIYLKLKTMHGKKHPFQKEGSIWFVKDVNIASNCVSDIQVLYSIIYINTPLTSTWTFDIFLIVTILLP